MIRCKNCGAQLGLLDEKCPYCGSINEEAKKHVAELKKYQNDYEDVKKDVTLKVHAYSKSYGLLAILVILLLVFLMLCMVLGNSYEFFSNRQMKTYKENEVMIERVLNDYIEAQDYERFVIYYEDVTDAIYDLDYDGVDRFYRLAYEYIHLKENILHQMDADTDYIDYASNAASNANWFFEEYLRFEIDHPYYKEALILYEECKDFLKAYLNLDESDFEVLESNNYKEIYEVIYRGIYEE